MQFWGYAFTAKGTTITAITVNVFYQQKPLKCCVLNLMFTFKSSPNSSEKYDGKGYQSVVN